MTEWKIKSTNMSQTYVIDGFLSRAAARVLVCCSDAAIGATIGRKTRAEIQKKSIELRNQTVETVDDAMTQARTKAQHITSDVR
jgi:hypothetical protein